MLAIVLAMAMSTSGQAEPAMAPVTVQVAPRQPGAVEQLLQQALVFARTGQNGQALALLDQMALEATNRVSKEKGPVYCAHSSAEAEGYLARAKADSQTVRLFQPSMCDVLFLRAYVLINLHRLPEATEQLRQLLALEPDFPHYQNEYASALRQAGDLDAALAVYRHAVEIAAPVKEYSLYQAAALRGIGFVLTERGDLDGAEKAYQQSLELASGHPIALQELAYIARLRATGVKTPPQTMESNINPAEVSMPDRKQPR